MVDGRSGWESCRLSAGYGISGRSLLRLVGRLEQQLADHRVSLTHLDATLRLFDPNLLLPDSGPQQRERVSWFRPGECLRLIYDVLREAPQPLTTRDVAGRVIAAKGITVD